MRCPTLNELPPPPPGKTGWPWTEQSQLLPERMPNDSQWPKLSIVTPSYNQGKFLEKTIRSVLLQGYLNLEYIVIDGGSTDESVEVIKKYEPWLTYWISEKDRGQSDAINKGFNQASGRILAWLNSDDYYLKDTLSRVGAYPWEEHIGAIVGVGYNVDINGKIIYTPKFSELNFSAFLDWMSSSDFMQPSCFFRRQAWLECGPLDTNLNYCMDVKLWLDISKKYSFSKINQTLSHALVHDTGKTNSQGEYSRAETILLIAKYGGEDIAKKELYKLMDELVRLKSIKDSLYKNPLIKHLLLPIYRKFF